MSGMMGGIGGATGPLMQKQLARARQEGVPTIKAHKLKVHVITNAAAASFITDVNTWFAARTQEEVVAVEFEYTNSLYTAYILYVED